MKSCRPGAATPSPDRPAAIFAANDELAEAACFTANRLGLRVPDDLSVAGIDDVATATAIWRPPRRHRETAVGCFQSRFLCNDNLGHSN